MKHKDITKYRTDLNKALSVNKESKNKIEESKVLTTYIKDKQPWVGHSLGSSECVYILLSILNDLSQANNVELAEDFSINPTDEEENEANALLEAEIQNGKVKALTFINQLKIILRGTIWGLENSDAGLTKLLRVGKDKTVKRLLQIGAAVNYLDTGNVAHNTWVELARWMSITHTVSTSGAKAFAASKYLGRGEYPSHEQLCAHYKEIAQNLPKTLANISKLQVQTVSTPSIPVSNAVETHTTVVEVSEKADKKEQKQEENKLQDPELMEERILVSEPIVTEQEKASESQAENAANLSSSGEEDDSLYLSTVVVPPIQGITIEDYECTETSVPPSNTSITTLKGAFFPPAISNPSVSLVYPEKDAEISIRFNQFEAFVQEATLTKHQIRLLLNFKTEVTAICNAYLGAWRRTGGVPNVTISVPILGWELMSRPHNAILTKLLKNIKKTEDHKFFVQQVYQTWASIPNTDNSDTKEKLGEMLSKMCEAIRPTVSITNSAAVETIVPTKSQSISSLRASKS